MRPGKIATIIGVLALLAAFFGVSLAVAQEKKKPKPPPKEGEGIYIVQRGF